MPNLDQRQAMAYSAAAIFAGAIAVGAVETAIPGGPAFSVVPSIVALIMVPVTLVLGPRVPRTVLALAGPLGAALIGYALATTHGYADAAVLYTWPVLWMAYFFGDRGTIFIVAWTGVVHGIALLLVPNGAGNVDRWVDVMVSVVVVGGVVRFLAARNDRLMTELAAEARADALTGLLNRRGFTERMELEVARAQREGYSLAAVAIDIDHFKWVNDEHGHEIGDRVMTWLGALLSAHARGDDLAARVGGEEFVLVLHRADAAEAHGVAERLRRTVSAEGPRSHRREHGISETLELTVSCGVAASTRLFPNGHELLDAADRALYAAKRAGRDRTVIDGDHAGQPELFAALDGGGVAGA